MKQGMFKRHARWLQRKRNFIIFSTLAFGLPLALSFFLGFHQYGGIGFWSLVTVACVLSGFVWGLIAWTVVGKRNEGDGSRR